MHMCFGGNRVIFRITNEWSFLMLHVKPQISVDFKASTKFSATTRSGFASMI
jgi:hypothetical protein